MNQTCLQSGYVALFFTSRERRDKAVSSTQVDNSSICHKGLTFLESSKVCSLPSPWQSLIPPPTHPIKRNLGF